MASSALCVALSAASKITDAQSRLSAVPPRPVSASAATCIHQDRGGQCSPTSAPSRPAQHPHQQQPASTKIGKGNAVPPQRRPTPLSIGISSNLSERGMNCSPASALSRPAPQHQDGVRSLEVQCDPVPRYQHESGLAPDHPRSCPCSSAHARPPLTGKAMRRHLDCAHPLPCTYRLCWPAAACTCRPVSPAPVGTRLQGGAE